MIAREERPADGGRRAGMSPSRGTGPSVGATRPRRGDVRKNPSRVEPSTTAGVVLLLLLHCLICSWALAAFEDLGAGARAPAMGNAFTALADDLYAVYYNPSGLGQLERPQLSATYSRLYMGLSDGSDLGLSQLTYAHPLKRGRWGTLGTAWQRFALSDIYQESSFYLSWGKSLRRSEAGSELLAGLNLKQLNHSFRTLPEAANACDQLACNKGADPVLSRSNSKDALDADFGLLYRFPKKFQLGLMAQHVMRPDVGFSDSDKLPMNLRLGGSFKSLWMNLVGELRMEPSPAGSTDRDFILGAERYFPTLEYGQFGLRGSVGFGSREWRQMTMGLSYRINKIQFDYGFLMPVGTVKGTAGAHRVAMTFHFGAPTEEEEISRELLEQARQLRAGKGPGYGYEFVDTMRPHDINDPKLAEVRRLIEAGQFLKAHQKLQEFAADLPPEAALVRLSNRLGLAAMYYPEFPAPQAPWELMLSSSIANFLRARDRVAVLQASYALTLNPNDVKLSNFLAKMEEGVGIKGEHLPPDHPRGLIQELFYRAEAAHNRGDYDKVLAVLSDVMLLYPDNVTGLERIGSTYYIIGKYREAVSAWERAAARESNAKERESLMFYINEARRKLGMPVPAGAPAAPAAPSPAEGAGFEVPDLDRGGPDVPQIPAERPAGPAGKAPLSPEPVVRPAKRPQPRYNDPREIPTLFQKGVEHYARGEYLQATAMFMRILQIDPRNVQARKALERIQYNAPKKPVP